MGHHGVCCIHSTSRCSIFEYPFIIFPLDNVRSALHITISFESPTQAIHIFFLVSRKMVHRCHFVSTFFVFISSHAPAHQLYHLRNSKKRQHVVHPSSWFKEAILTLLGVCVTVACFVVGLAWPCLRKRLCTLSSSCRPGELCYCVKEECAELMLGTVAVRSSQLSRTIKGWKKRDPEEIRQQLQERYDQLLEMRRGRF
jgi:hypothetical protein